jgi:hypothetical protein
MKPHRLDGLSFTFGIIFLGVVAWWLFGAQFDVELPSGGWFVAGALIVFGVVGLIGALRPDRTKPESVQPSSAQPVYQVSPAPMASLDEDLYPRTGDSATNDR